MALSGTFYNYPYQQFGVYCEWSGTQDIPGNYTDVTVKVYVSYYTLNIGERSGTVTINGTGYTFTSPEIRDMSGGSYKKVLVATKTGRVNHNSDGSKPNVALSAEWDCTLTYHDTYYSSITASDTVTLTAIDRAAPTVTLQTSNITSGGVSLVATSSAVADRWEYKLNSGSWTVFSTAEGQSASTTLDSLSPNTAYSITVRARRKLNQVYGTSSAASITTLGGSELLSVNTLTVNADVAKIQYAIRVYDSTYKHTLTVSKGGSTLLTFSNITGAVGNNNRTVTLTTAQKQTLMNAMPNEASTSLTYTLTTYNSSNVQIGSGSTKTATAQITEAAAPTFTTYTTEDVNRDTLTVTGDSSVLVQGKSTLRVNCSAATAGQGATIVKYIVTVGAKTVESSNVTVAFGVIDDVSGEVGVTVTAQDSRGFRTSVSGTLTVIPYHDIVIDSWNVRRQNNVETTILLTFAGEYSPIVVNNVEKNSLTSVVYQTKRTNESTYGSSTALTATVSNHQFEYDGSPLTLSDAYSYNVKITVADALSSSSVVVKVDNGRPLMAFRYEKVGINTNSPQSALDVNGIVRMNGSNVMGKVNYNLGASIDLDDVTESGIYAQTSSDAEVSNHYPSTSNGVLEVIAITSLYVVQRYTATSDGTQYIRSLFGTSWSSWVSGGGVSPSVSYNTSTHVLSIS